MNRAVLIRHGESEANILRIVDDDVAAKYHLTDIGKGQINYALTQLKKLKLDKVVSSPILRARESADIIAQAPWFSICCSGIPSRIIFHLRIFQDLSMWSGIDAFYVLPLV